MKRKLIAIGIAVGAFVVLYSAAGFWVISQLMWTDSNGGRHVATDAASMAVENEATGSFFIPCLIAGLVIAALYYWLSAPKKVA